MRGRPALAYAFMPVDCARCGARASAVACFCCPDWCNECWREYSAFSREQGPGHSVREFARLPIERVTA